MSIFYKWIRGGSCVFFIMVLSQTLYAKSSLQSVFSAIYGDSESADAADCQVCHAESTFQLNSYGKALCDQLTDETTSLERLMSFADRASAVESFDSDGDGSSNIDEISNSVQPGWTLSALNSTYVMSFNSNECVSTGNVEGAPSWIESDELDPSPVGNAAPIALNDVVSTPTDTPLTIDVLANDSDANGDSIEVLAINSGLGAHGVVSNNVTDITYTPESGFCGTAIFQYQVSDGLTSSGEATVTVSVGDTEAPQVIAPPSNLTVFLSAENTQLPASNSEIVNWLATASATDSEDGDLTVNVNAPASFVSGTTSVIFSAIDSCGNTSTASADVIVVIESNNEPVVTAPNPDPVELTASLCATSLPSADASISNWLGLATAFDTEDGNLTVSNNAPSNFLIGDTTVVFSAVDSLGAIGSISSTVSVSETPNSAPELDAPTPITIIVSLSTTSVSSSDASIQDFLSFASATDSEDGSLAVTHNAPTEFGLGATTVTFEAVDDCGVSISGQSTITVIVDQPVINNPPSITAPSPINIEAALCANSLSSTDPLITDFLNGATASDEEDDDLTSSVSHDAPANFLAATSPGVLTTVTFSVTDSGEPTDSPMTATTTSTIRLTDPNTTPTITAPIAITTTISGASIPASNAEITAFLASAIAQDQQDGVLPISNNAPAVFEPGTTPVTFTATDSCGLVVSSSSTVTIPVDTTAPVITLLGSNPINVEQHTAFVDPGATANDNIDGDITVDIVASGSVNTAAVGSYTRSYNVSDAAGNAAVTITRTVNVTAVADNTSPVITLLGNNPLEITVGGGYSEAGAVATDNVDGNISGSIAINSSAVNTSAIGSYLVTYNVSDAAGNAASGVTRTVNIIPVADITSPVIILSGDNPLEIIEGGTFSEPGYSASDNIDGNITSSVSVNSSSVNTSVVGSYSVTYNVSDAAGNAATTITRTVNVVSATTTYLESPVLSVGAASISTTLYIADDNKIADINVFIDMQHDYPGDVSITLISPSGTSVAIVQDPGKPASTWGCSNDDFLVTLDDEGSGNVEDACASPPAISGTLVPNNALSAFDGESTQGTWTLQLDDSYTQSDTGTLNNWSLIITAEVAGPSDNTAPVIILSGDNPLEIIEGGTYSEPGYSATDNIDGDITGSVLVNSSALDTSAIGSYSVTYNVSDAAGNTASTVTRTVNVTEAVDTTEPVITLLGDNPLEITVGGSYNESGAMATDDVDGNISGSITINSSAVNTSSIGTYSVTYSVSDAAGNAAATVTRVVNVTAAADTTAPVITLSGGNPLEISEGGTYNEPGYSASDNADGNITGSVVVDASSVDANTVGSYLVTYNVSDVAGNAATTVTRTVNVTSSTTTYSENPGLGVGVASISTTLTIADDSQIADLNVYIDMQHDYPGDVSITLISPSGTSVAIVQDPGKPASTWGCSNDDFLVTLDDEGSGNVEDACASPPAISGTLIPNNALSAFDGESTQGMWTLQLDDSYTQSDTGTLNSWSLIVTAQVIDTLGLSGDVTPPILSLLGDSVIEHPNGATFNDPGAAASDNIDGNISANITTSGTVDVNTNGTYVLTYSVQDAAGNAAPEISRTVNVSSASTIFTEAETGTTGGNHSVDTSHAGYTGSGFVDYAGEGYMEYTFEGNAVPYDLTIRYALVSGNRPLEVVLNGSTLGSINFPATGAWTSWLTTAPFTITPLSGTNTLRLQTSGSSGANVDSHTLTPQ